MSEPTREQSQPDGPGARLQEWRRLYSVAKASEHLHPYECHGTGLCRHCDRRCGGFRLKELMGLPENELAERLKVWLAEEPCALCRERRP